MATLDILNRACESLMLNQRDFWLAAGMLDVSFETGRSRKLPPKSAIELLQQVLGANDLFKQLKLGVNGNLGRILTEQNPTTDMKFDEYRGSIKPDIQIFSPDRRDTVAEVKAVYCMTEDKFYGRCGHGVCDDRDKLVALRTDPTVANRFQIIFFLELPNYHYPSGCSYAPTWEHHEARHSYFKHERIARQYQAVLSGIIEHPAWPGDPPRVVPLVLPTPEILQRLNRWFADKDHIYRPDDNRWSFDASAQLAGAAVGCAIWSY